MGECVWFLCQSSAQPDPAASRYMPGTSLLSSLASAIPATTARPSGCPVCLASPLALADKALPGLNFAPPPENISAAAAEIARVQSCHSEGTAYLVDVCIGFECDCCAVATFETMFASSVGEARLRFVSWVTWRHWLHQPTPDPVEGPQHPSVLSVCCIASRDSPQKSVTGNEESRWSLKVMYTRRPDSVLYAELLCVAGEDRWTVREVGDLPLTWHSDAAFQCWGTNHCVRRLLWLPGFMDFTGKCPLVAALHHYAGSLGDPPLDHLTVAMVQVGGRTALDGPSVPMEVERVEGTLCDGPWAVRAVTLAHPSFLWAYSGEGEESLLLGCFTRPPPFPFPPSPLLRAAPGKGRERDAGEDDPVFALTLYNSEGEVTRSPTVGGFVEDAVTLVSPGPTACDGSPEVLGTIVVLVFPRHAPTSAASGAPAFHILRVTSEGSGAACPLRVSLTQTLVYDYDSHFTPRLPEALCSLMSVWSRTAGSDAQQAGVYAVFVFGCHCEDTSALSLGARLLFIHSVMAPSCLLGGEVASSLPPWVQLFLSCSHSQLLLPWLLTNTCNARYSKRLHFLSAPYTTGYGEVVAWCPVLLGEKNYMVALLRSGCLCAWPNAAGMSQAAVEHWAMLQLPGDEELQPGGPRSVRSAHFDSMRHESVAVEYLLSAEVGTAQMLALVPTRDTATALSERCLLLCCVGSCALLLGGSTGRVHHAIHISTTPFALSQLSLLWQPPSAEFVAALSGLQLSPASAEGNTEVTTTQGCVLRSLCLLRVGVLAYPAGLSSESAKAPVPVVTLAVTDAVGWPTPAGDLCPVPPPTFSVEKSTDDARMPAALLVGCERNVLRFGLQSSHTSGSTSDWAEETVAQLSRHGSIAFSYRDLSPDFPGGLVYYVPLDCPNFDAEVRASAVALVCVIGSPRLRMWLVARHSNPDAVLQSFPVTLPAAVAGPLPSRFLGSRPLASAQKTEATGRWLLTVQMQDRHICLQMHGQALRAALAAPDNTAADGLFAHSADMATSVIEWVG